MLGEGEGEPPETAKELDEAAPDSATIQSIGRVTVVGACTRASQMMAQAPAFEPNWHEPLEKLEDVVMYSVPSSC